jgi:hypothetical protein
VLVERKDAAAVVPPPAVIDAPKVTAHESHASQPEDEDAKQVSDLIESLKGADLVTRIRRYEELFRAKPNSKYARTIGEEASVDGDCGGSAPARDRAVGRGKRGRVACSPRGAASVSVLPDGLARPRLFRGVHSR